MTNESSLAKAIEGVDYIIHVASPIPSNQNRSESQMVEPAREGMKSIIKAAVANKVKRIVVTSSMATVVGNGFKRSQGVFTYDENDYAPWE